MKGIHAFLERLRSGRRPPTGPLTTAESATADELRKHTALEDGDRTEHAQGNDADSALGSSRTG
jgi:hypothetical protein